MFLSPSDNRANYYRDQVKLPFEVQTIRVSPHLIVILIEKMEIIFAVDASLEFDQLCLYSTNGSHEIKQHSGHYFKGIALMNNMLQKEMIPNPNKSN